MITTIAVLLVTLAVVLSGGAIIRNGVPLAEPPGPAKRLIIYLTRNTASTRDGHEFPELRPRTYGLSPERTLELATKAAAEAGWDPVDVDAGGHALHAVVTTPWLRFKDDVRATVRAAPGGGTLVEIESRSRIGRADYGANIAHIIELYRRLDALTE